MTWLCWPAHCSLEFAYQSTSSQKGNLAEGSCYGQAEGFYYGQGEDDLHAWFADLNEKFSLQGSLVQDILSIYENQLPSMKPLLTCVLSSSRKN